MAITDVIHGTEFLLQGNNCSRDHAVLFILSEGLLLSSKVSATQPYPEPA
jgi:hypothetical protein